MKSQSNFSNLSKNQINPVKIKTNNTSTLLSDVKSNRNKNKNISLIIRKNLLSITKEDIERSKQLLIKSYKEDIELEKLNTAHSLNIINSDIYNNDILELSSGEKLNLEYLKKKYANKDYSSSNLSD